MQGGWYANERHWFPCEAYHLPCTRPYTHKGQPQHRELHALLFSNSATLNSVSSHIELINMEGICETGPTVYRPYPRRQIENALGEAKWNFTSLTPLELVITRNNPNENS